MGERIDWVELGGGVGPVQPAKVTGGGEEGGADTEALGRNMYCKTNVLR